MNYNERTCYFQFLKDLSENNNREWFQEHRAEYEVVREEFEKLLAAAITRISKVWRKHQSVQPKDCTYRIYRDTRFSADKTPYKPIWVDTSMPKARSLTIAAITFIWKPGNCAGRRKLLSAAQYTGKL